MIPRRPARWANDVHRHDIVLDVEQIRRCDRARPPRHLRRRPRRLTTSSLSREEPRVACLRRARAVAPRLRRHGSCRSCQRRTISRACSITPGDRLAGVHQGRRREVLVEPVPLTWRRCGPRATGGRRAVGGRRASTSHGPTQATLSQPAPLVPWVITRRIAAASDARAPGRRAPPRRRSASAGTPPRSGPSRRARAGRNSSKPTANCTAAASSSAAVRGHCRSSSSRVSTARHRGSARGRWPPHSGHPVTEGRPPARARTDRPRLTGGRDSRSPGGVRDRGGVRAIDASVNGGRGLAVPGRSKDSAQTSSANSASSRHDGVRGSRRAALSGLPACRTARARPPTSIGSPPTHPTTVAGV